MNSNSFINKIMDMSNLVFIITSTNKKLYFYLESKILKINEFVDDLNSFIYSFDNKQKYQITKPFFSSKYESFKLFYPEDDKLFMIGNEDIVIYKKGKEKECYSKSTSFKFGTKNPLTTNGNNGKFELKQFLIIQME